MSLKESIDQISTNETTTEFENLPNKNSKNVTRKLLKKEVITGENENKNAIYYYEIFDDQGNKIGNQKVISRSKTFSVKYNEEEHYNSKCT